MSNPFTSWTLTKVQEHNARVRPLKIDTAASLLAEAKERETKKKTAKLRAANGKSESEIQQEIESFLKNLGASCWYHKTRMDRATTCRPGVPDFFGAINVNGKGIAWAFEVKKPHAKPTVEQNGELLWLSIAGARVGIVYSSEDARIFFDSILTRRDS